MIALRTIAVGFWLVLMTTGLQAQSVWHCSRQAMSGSADDGLRLGQAPDDTFQIASMGTNPDVIGITLRDLLDVYSGVPVRIGGKPLTACFNNDNSPVSLEALASLGLNANAMSALARKSAIVRSQLQWVSNEQDMMRCIQRHYPAVGYFKDPQDTDEVLPCF